MFLECLQVAIAQLADSFAAQVSIGLIGCLQHLKGPFLFPQNAGNWVGEELVQWIEAEGGRSSGSEHASEIRGEAPLIFPHEHGRLDPILA